MPHNAMQAGQTIRSAAVIGEFDLPAQPVRVERRNEALLQFQSIAIVHLLAQFIRLLGNG